MAKNFVYLDSGDLKTENGDLNLGTAWGAITGTLANQTDLQNVLDGKEDDLGNPSVTGQVLSSTTAGTRSWVDQEGGTGGGESVWYMAIITSSETFNVPTGVNNLLVSLCGAGQGGYQSTSTIESQSAKGGSGGFVIAEQPVVVTPGEAISVTIGLGGVGGDKDGLVNPTDGGDSSFGSYLSAPGGGFGLFFSNGGDTDSLPIAWHGMLPNAGHGIPGIEIYNSSLYAGGGGAGLFGKGGDGEAVPGYISGGAHGEDASANSGAGGGGAASNSSVYEVIGGEGADGICVVRWCI